MIAEKIKGEILNRIENKNLSIALLEKKAGLPTNSIRNIIAGGSKNPGIKSLSAIAKVLECSVNDLLGQTDSRSEKQHTQVVEHNELILELINQIITFIGEYTKKHKLELSFEDFLFFVQKAYIFAIQKNAKKINTSFIEWLIENKYNI